MRGLETGSSKNKPRLPFPVCLPKDLEHRRGVILNNEIIEQILNILDKLLINATAPSVEVTW